MNIVRRIDARRRRGFRPGDGRLIDRVAVERLFHRNEPQRPVADADGAAWALRALPPASS